MFRVLKIHCLSFYSGHRLREGNLGGGVVEEGESGPAVTGASEGQEVSPAQRDQESRRQKGKKGARESGR